MELGCGVVAAIIVQAYVHDIMQCRGVLVLVALLVPATVSIAALRHSGWRGYTKKLRGRINNRIIIIIIIIING
jgi:F0F1-type ATP synthase membrane subunit a